MSRYLECRISHIVTISLKEKVPQGYFADYRRGHSEFRGARTGPEPRGSGEFRANVGVLFMPSDGLEEREWQMYADY